MKLFIFENLFNVSPNWHPGGGAVVIAKDIEHAKLLIEEDGVLEVTDEEWKDVNIYNLSVSFKLPKIYIFPDAGCC